MNVSILAGAAFCAALSLPQNTDESAVPDPVSDPISDSALALRRADEAFCADAVRDGLDGWMRWFDDGAVVLDPFGQLWRGPLTLREHYQRMGWPVAGLRWKATDAVLSTSGDLGYTVGRWHVGEAREGSYLSVWSKDAEGQWRVIMDQGGDPAHRTRFNGGSAPRKLVFEDMQHIAVESGDLRACLGHWAAAGAEGSAKGTYLTVWQRTQDGWEIAASIGAPIGG